MFLLVLTSLRSQQEPRLLCSMAHDQAMLDAYKAKKDLYATIAQGIYHNKYEDNLEHHLDGSPNPEGKKRRSNCKSILLGIMYGRGVASIAEQTGCTVAEAQKIIDGFYQSFPAVKKWTDKTQEDAKKLGYVEDFMGRRRRLPDLLKPKYTITVQGEDASVSPNFNPLLGCKGIIKNQHPSKSQKWQSKLEKVRGRNEYQKLKAEAETEGVTIIDNGAFIAQAERQCVNARIQGGASTITKIAMTRVYNDPVLNELEFKLLICVHDELIGECPEENAQKCADRLSEVMIDAVKGLVECPMKCDSVIMRSWYEDELAAKLQEYYTQQMKLDKSEEDIKSDILEKHKELSKEQLDYLLTLEL